MKIGIIGIGLMGGSFALDFRSKNKNSKIYGFDTNKKSLDYFSDFSLENFNMSPPNATARHKKSLEQALLEDIENKGYELIEIEQHSLRKGIKFVLYIDHDNGIGLDDCVNVSKASEMIIDEFIDPESYELEVSSPGLDRKLNKKEDFDRFIGKTIKIRLKEKLNDRKNFKGLLTDRRGDMVILEDDQVFEIPMDRIDICRIVPQFN